VSTHLIVQVPPRGSQREILPRYLRGAHLTKKGIRGWRVVVVAMVGRTLLLAWDVSAYQEEPWRRLLQELSEARREEEAYVVSRRRLGISAESVWLVPKPCGGGMAAVYLEALDPERALRELAASEAPFDSWYSGEMRKLFGFDLARVPRVAGGELLFAWRDSSPGEREVPKNPWPDASLHQRHIPPSIQKGGAFESETDGGDDCG
jgi:hypothetical protein